MLPTPLSALCSEQAEKFKVAATIHPEDELFEFLRRMSPNDAMAVEHYFADGFKCATQFKQIIRDYIWETRTNLSVLEFASGFGRVSRHFKNVAPEVNLTCCDIHVRAIEFAINDLGIRALPSNSDPDLFETIERFDVVFALSFFSHVPDHTFARWLKVARNNARRRVFSFYDAW